jgi:hypothetical protein
MSDLSAEQKLKGAMIFKYLKTGKMPKRKGLFRILFYLAGQHAYFVGINMTSSSVTNKRPNVDRTIEIKIRPSKLNIDLLNDVLKKYLVEYELKLHNFFATIYYSSNHVQWSLIDEELRKNHAENIIEKDGLPRILNYRYEKK